MNNPSERIAANWYAVRNEVAEAATRCGRDPQSIRIVGVTKYVGAEETAALVRAGCRDLGESRPQSLWEKAGALEELPIRWHLIGHLQRNKARRTVPRLSLIHSVDSVRIANAVSRLVEENTESPALHGLLEVNISGDTAKHGLAPGEMAAAIEAIAPLGGLQVVGLMAMASYGNRGEAARRDFAALRQLRDRLVEDGLPANVRLDDLSMGMSGDFPQAIAEGATIVRIGSRLFAGLDHDS
jgi:hypothetical protein